MTFATFQFKKRWFLIWFDEISRLNWVKFERMILRILGILYMTFQFLPPAQDKPWQTMSMFWRIAGVIAPATTKFFESSRGAITPFPFPADSHVSGIWKWYIFPSYVAFITWLWHSAILGHTTALLKKEPSKLFFLLKRRNADFQLSDTSGIHFLTPKQRLTVRQCHWTVTYLGSSSGSTYLLCRSTTRAL